MSRRSAFVTLMMCWWTWESSSIKSELSRKGHIGWTRHGNIAWQKETTNALGCTKPEGWPSYAFRKIVLIPTSADGTRESPWSLDAERPSQLLPYSPHQEWRRIGVSWWRGRICLRTDAASTSQMDLQVVPVPDPLELVRSDRPTCVTRRIGEAKEKDIRSTSRSNERRKEAHRPSRSPIRTSRSQYGQQPGK